MVMESHQTNGTASNIVVLLRSDRYADVCLLDADTGIWSLASRNMLAVRHLEPSGQCSLIEGYGDIFTAFYRYGGQLFFRHGLMSMSFTDEVTTTWQALEKRASFRILRSGEPLFEIKYNVPKDALNIESDPTPFVEADHFDFFLFIHHILNNPTKRAVFH